MIDDLASLLGFKGCARLFPLPNLVLFPYAVQPLHIFEPRYRQMTRDALHNDRLIAMVLLRPGWEADYGGRPAIYSMACLGKIVAEQKLDDGRYNILLRGLCRVYVGQEIQGNKPYRQAEVALIADPHPPTAEVERKLRRQIGHYAPRWFRPASELMDHFRHLLDSELPLGSLCDILAFALPFDIAFKQELLEELNITRRAKRLVQQLKSKPPLKAEPVTVGRKFPPDFSAN